MRKFYEELILISVVLATVTAFALDYAVSDTKYGEPVAQFKTGKTPLPAGSAYPIPDILRNVNKDYLIVENGVLREKTTQEKADFDAAYQVYLVAQSNEMVQAVADWNTSKTNNADIYIWENRFMLRLAQANGILLSEGIITNALDPSTAPPEDIATYMIQATNPAASSVGVALGVCDTWVQKITIDTIGNPPDGSSVRSHIVSH